MPNIKDLIGDSMARSLGSSFRSIEEMTKATIGGINDTMLKRQQEALDSTEKLARLTALNGAASITAAIGGINNTMLKRQQEALDSTEKLAKFDTLGINEEIKRALDRTSLLAQGVDDAISRIRIPDRIDHGMFDAVLGPPAVLELPDIEFAPNPIFETNSQLAELKGNVTQLVDVAKQQAELTREIKNTSDLALSHAAQSGVQAKAATRLGKMAIIVAIITSLTSIGLTVYENHRQSASSEAHRREDILNRQEEIRVLREISGQLNGLGGRATTAIKPQPKSEGKAKQ